MLKAAVVVLHFFIGATAVAAGTAFVRHPSGEDLKVPQEWLEGSPFPDYRAPGLFLAGVIGPTHLASAVSVLRGQGHSCELSLGSSVILMLWIAIQTMILGPRHWSQALWWLVFSLLTLLSMRRYSVRHARGSP